MTYGVSADKFSCVYVMDNGVNVLCDLSDDTIAAGSFSTTIPAGAAPHPSKKGLKMRHVGLWDSAGSKRKELKIATLAAFNGINLGSSLTYAGKTWEVVGKHGEQSVE
jgi:hypothetical protein